MARINWDDEFEADDRFKRLVRIIGNEDLARGLMMRFLRMAQRFWGDEMRLVPEEDFEADGFGPILQVKLAECREGGVYALSHVPGEGAAEMFAWYLQKCQAGKKGGRPPKNNRNERAGYRDEPPGLPEESCRLTGEASPRNPPVPVPVPVLSSSSTSSKGATEISETGPIPELADLLAAEMLTGLSHKAQRIWLDTYGLEFIRAQIPKAFAKWMTDTVRSRQGGPALYLLQWFQNVKPSKESPGPSGPEELVWCRVADVMDANAIAEHGISTKFFSYTKRQYEKLKTDFNNGRGGIPPPIAGIGREAPRG